jgi:hypothetical protein
LRGGGGARRDQKIPKRPKSGKRQKRAKIPIAKIRLKKKIQNLPKLLKTVKNGGPPLGPNPPEIRHTCQTGKGGGGGRKTLKSAKAPRATRSRLQKRYPKHRHNLKGGGGD